MAHHQCINTFAMMIVWCAFFTLPGTCLSFPQRGSTLEGGFPLSQSGYTVPLQGGETCISSYECTNKLSAPAPNKTLTYLALGRGIATYDCTGRLPTEPPVYGAQSTSLWDAAPLLPLIDSEELFHTIIPQLYEYDYTQLANSSLKCIGTITTVRDQSVIELRNIDTFGVNIQQVIEAPTLPDFNAVWAHETSLDLVWDIYRVETVSGRPPKTCTGRKSLFQIQYAAEYWFYHP